jgi:hypothetical protein
MTCVTNKHGMLSALLQDSWEDQDRVTTTGKRIVLDFYVPYTSVIFSVTSPTTCHDKSITCDSDPKFTTVFDLHLILKFTSNDPTKLAFAFQDQHFGDSLLNSIVEGDRTGEVIHATVEFAENVIPDAASEDYVAVAKDVAEYLSEITSITVGVIANQHLRDEVSAKLSTVASPTLGNLALSLSNQFDQLFAGLESGVSQGFRDLSVVSDGHGNLIWRLTMPPASAPTLFNIDASTNSQPSIIQPEIGADKLAVPAGQTLSVNGEFFPSAYTTHLNMGWSGNIAGGPVTTQIQWAKGTTGGTVATVTATGKNYVFTGLTPGTAYRFNARQCTPITCSPWSGWYATATQSSGSDTVAIYLDSVTVGNAIGSATLLSGNFTAPSVTIPAGTTPGAHTLIVTAGNQKATLSITVCSGSTCQPNIAVVDAFAGMPVQRAMMGSVFNMVGSNFAANGRVYVYSDPTGGVSIGNVVLNNGAFKTQFTMPYLPTSGWHNITAKQTILFGHSLQAEVKVDVESPPH